MDKFFRSTDLIMCFWQAGGGISSWIIERNGQLFMYAILAGQRGLQLLVETWASNDDRTQVDAARRVMRLLGFTEHPIYMQYESAKKAGMLAKLESDVQIYLADLERQKEEIKKIQEQQKTAQKDVEKAGAEPGDKKPVEKVTPIKPDKK